MHIIVDSKTCRDEILRLAERLEPKPAVLFYAHDLAAAESSRKVGKPPFHMGEMLVDEKTRLCVYDAQMEKALGPERVKRLEYKPGEPSSSTQWHYEEKVIKRCSLSEPNARKPHPTFAGASEPLNCPWITKSPLTQPNE